MSYFPKPPSVRFRCPNCGGLVHEFLEATEVYGHDVVSGADDEEYDRAILMCNHCGQNIDLDVSISASGLVVELAGTNDRVEVLDDPTHLVDRAILDIEQYELDNTPADPKTYFQYAVYDIDHVRTEMQRYPIDAVPRMLFAQYFSAIEAYLSDRLIGLVRSDPTAMASLVANNTEWSDQKIKVTELAANPNALSDWAIKQLKEIIYHNFSKVDMYYRGAMGTSIFPDDNVKTTVQRFLPLRHDCVHRYGRDKDGRKSKIDDKDLDNLGAALKRMVDHIENAFHARKK